MVILLFLMSFSLLSKFYLTLIDGSVSFRSNVLDELHSGMNCNTLDYQLNFNESQNTKPRKGNKKSADLYLKTTPESAAVTSEVYDESIKKTEDGK